MFLREVMRNYLKILPLTILLITGYQSTSKASNWEDELKVAANELNQGLPMMVDSETRLDSSIAFKNTFLYKYTMINYAIDDISTEKFTNAMRPIITNTVCTTEDMKVFVQNHTEVKYLYHDKNGNFLSQIIVKTEEC